ncbi:MAG: hypothetical protein ABIK98_05055 [Pseudomonadota bacterium]
MTVLLARLIVIAGESDNRRCFRNPLEKPETIPEIHQLPQIY